MDDEVVARYDAAGHEVGSVSRTRAYTEGLWHATAGVLVRSADGSKVYVHRRTQTKAAYPGLCDVVAGGVLAPGETTRQAAARELAEELGLSDVALRLRGSLPYDDGVLRYHMTVFEAFSDGPLVHQASEVAEGWWWTPEQLRAHLADPTFAFVPDTRAMLEALGLACGTVDR